MRRFWLVDDDRSVPPDVPAAARPDVARRDPAVEAPPFELLDDSHGGVAILADMADEQEYFSRRHAPEPFAAPIPISLA